MAMRSFTPAFHEAKYCDLPACIFNNYGVLWVKKISETLLYPTMLYYEVQPSVMKNAKLMDWEASKSTPWSCKLQSFSCTPTAGEGLLYSWILLVCKTGVI
jgi:hypothetical protein